MERIHIGHELLRQKYPHTQLAGTRVTNAVKFFATEQWRRMVSIATNIIDSHRQTK
jgi:hypothetical protein